MTTSQVDLYTKSNLGLARKLTHEILQVFQHFQFQLLQKLSPSEGCLFMVKYTMFRVEK